MAVCMRAARRLPCRTWASACAQNVHARRSSAAAPCPPSSGPGQINPECLDSVLPFDARFLEALDLKRVAEPSAFEEAVRAAFDQIDKDGDGALSRAEAESLLRDRIYCCCPPDVWSVTPEELLEKLGGNQERVTRAEFTAAVEQMSETLDRRVWPLAQSQFFSAIMFAINQPLMPLLVKELGISMHQFGGIVALMPLTRVALSFPAVFLANRYGRKSLTVEGQLLAAAGFSLSAFIANPWQLILSRLVTGAGTSFAGVGQQTMLGDISTGRTRSRVFAPGQMFASAAFAVGPAVGGWLASNIGVKAAYLVVGTGMAAVSLRNHYILTETLRGRSAPAEELRASLDEIRSWGRDWLALGCLFWKDEGLRVVTAANVCYNFTSISAKFVLLPMLALDCWGLGGAGLGAMLGSISILQSLASTPAAYIADRYGRQVALLPGLGLSAVSMVSAASGLDVYIAVPLVCGTWALGAAFVGSVPAGVVLDMAGRQHLGQQETTRALALSRVMGDLGMVAGSVASGALLSSLDAQMAFCTQASVLSVAAMTAAAAILRGKR